MGTLRFFEHDTSVRPDGHCGWRHIAHLSFAEPHAADLRLQRLRQGDVGHRRHGHTPHPPAAQRVVLGGLSGGDPSNGMSTKQLQSALAIASNETAWLLSMNLRAAMIAAERTRLSGLVEADETTIPSRTSDDPPAGGQGRSHDGKLLLIGAVEVVSGKNDKRTLGRLSLAPIADLPGPPCMRLSERTPHPAASSKPMGSQPISTRRTSPTSRMLVGTMAAPVVLPGIHRVFSNLKTWALGVYHGLRRRHLKAYLDEFVNRISNLFKDKAE